MNTSTPTIFLSYAHEDIGMAKRLYRDLKRYGLTVWLDTESLLPGDRWRDRIQDAIEQSHFFLALLSTRSLNKKGFVQKELKTALEVLDLFPDSQKFILPLRLDACEVGNRKLREHHWVDLFPDGEYQNGLKKILQVVSPGTFLLRSTPKKLSPADVNEMIVAHGFYDINKNPGGKGFQHQYKVQNIRGDTVVFDEATGLMWQQGGSSNYMNYEDAKKYIADLNRNKFAGYSDWRLPTLEEAMSLMMEPEKKAGLYIDSEFDETQRRIWTSDPVAGEPWAWVVSFVYGGCSYDHVGTKVIFVRAVRSGQSSGTE